MKTYTFVRKNGNGTLYLSAEDTMLVMQELSRIVKNMYEWRMDDWEDGEETKKEVSDADTTTDT